MYLSKYNEYGKKLFCLICFHIYYLEKSDKHHYLDCTFFKTCKIERLSWCFSKRTFEAHSSMSHVLLSKQKLSNLIVESIYQIIFVVNVRTISLANFARIQTFQFLPVFFGPICKNTRLLWYWISCFYFLLLKSVWTYSFRIACSSKPFSGLLVID